jgi:colanic acid/amylovoran biosynthesis glycosyltransferase
MVLLKSLNVFKFKKEAASLNILYKVVPFLDKDPYDIVHCHFGPNGILGILLKDIGAIKGKLITTFHGYDATSYPQIYGDNIYKDMFRKVDKITVNSNFTKNKVVALGCSMDKIVILPVGLNPSKFFLKERTMVPGDEVRILTVARLVEKKGIEYSIKAVAKVLEKHSNIRYDIVGDGPLRDQLSGLIDQIGIANQVKLLGWKNQEEICQLYSEAHIFILSSVTACNGDQEGQGLVLQEAQASGLPVIATLHNGFPESVMNGKSAFLVPERNFNALAERLGYLIERPDIWPEIGRAGRRYVEEYFDINKLNDQLVEIYKKLIN